MVRRARRNPEEMELEARIGRIVGGHFCVGVTRSHMDELVNSIDAYREAHPDDIVCDHAGWQEENNYYFDDSKKRALRSRIVHDDSGLAVTTVQKRIIETALLRTLTYDVKVSLCSEKTIPPSDLDDVVGTTLVRFKQVRRYRCPRSCLELSCSATWSGKTETAAETSQKAGDATYEAECELNAAALPETESDERVARNLLFKTASLMMTPGQRYEIASNYRPGKRGRD
jgi:hypothetical protein